RTLSGQGEEFIIEFEGFRSKLYEDQAGHCSIGVGHLVHLGSCTASDRREFRGGLTRAEGIDLMVSDARSKIDCVASNVDVALTQEQFDALVSFTFNVGEGAFEDSTLLRKLNEGDFAAVPKELARWNKVTIDGEKVVSNGLTRRRGREAKLFSTGSYVG
ncbi:MAG TPA: lysozyme, partial [Nocardioidaceae bacterium]|nr:lysozyme [Nocardioidaceae bacterium]